MPTEAPMPTVPLSILDLAPIPDGAGAPDAFAAMDERARAADRLGYTRYWLAEHHNMSGVACSATGVLVGHVAGITQRIRVGSGGVMLPNHVPLVVAEQFGTLATLYPGRIDLGLGRAPGTDPLTARALRRERSGNEHDFPRDVLELQAYFDEPEPEQPVRAVPGTGLRVPIWLLGSSLFSAQLAAHLGLPYAFAAHFAPDDLGDALHVYRTGFRPSAQLQAPYAMVGINIVAADTDAEARRLFTSQQLQSLHMLRGQRGPLPAPVDDIESEWSPPERDAVTRKLACSVVGGPETVRRELAAFVERTGADELIVNVRIHDTAAAVRSLEVLAAAADLSPTGATS